MHVTAAPRRADLGSELAARLGTDLLTYDRDRFPDGEVFIQLDASVEGPVVVLADTRPDEHLVEAIVACDAAREAGADDVHLAVPYMAYARQDRSFERGQAVSSRAVNAALSSVAEGLATVDVHDARVLDYFDGPARSQTASPEIADALAGESVSMVLAPDTGARESAGAVAKRLDVPFDHLEKTRESSTEVSMAPKSLDVEGDVVAIVDDIISTGGTMATAAGQLLEQGASRIVVAATHGLFVSGADERLDAAGVDRVLTSDSIPGDRTAFTCAGALARGLKRLQEA